MAAARTPTKGKKDSSSAYLTIGQDYESIRAYLDDITPSTPPHAYMVYTDLQTLMGLSSPVNYGSGIEYANGVIELSHQYFPNSLPSLQIGLWLNGTLGCRDILNHQYQAQIVQLFQYCMANSTNLAKIYLRIGYEFDNPDFRYNSDPDIYRHTFQYLVDECERLYSTKCRETMEFVWHSWAATTYTSYSSPQLNDFYPGDDYVDWIGISVFSQLYTVESLPQNVSALGTPATVRLVCDFARHHDKRIMIAESTPFGGIDQLNDPWSDWFVPVLDLIEEYTIQMWSYIYCNWKEQPMWRNAGFGDSRLSQNATLVRLWQHQVLSNPRFVSAPFGRKVVPPEPSTMARLDPSLENRAVDSLGDSAPWLDRLCPILLTISVLVMLLQNVIRRWMPSSTKKASRFNPIKVPFCSQSCNQLPLSNYGAIDEAD